MKTYILRVYQSKDGWRWRIKARNGRTVADSAEAYSSQRAAYRAADSLADSRIVITEQRRGVYKVIA